MKADLHVSSAGNVRILEIRRPPHNFFDLHLVEGLADLLEELDEDAACRAIVLCSEGTAFCAGADLTKDVIVASRGEAHPIYQAALRIYACRKPLIAAVHGAAVGGGLGLAVACDFRVTCPEARFSANFARLGVHAGFGLSVMLPRLVGTQYANFMLLTARRIDGEEAVLHGLADVLVRQESVRAEAVGLAAEIALNSPLAVQSMRATSRDGLLQALSAAVIRESSEQFDQFLTCDFREGVNAMSERRTPQFRGR